MLARTPEAGSFGAYLKCYPGSVTSPLRQRHLPRRSTTGPCARSTAPAWLPGGAESESAACFRLRCGWGKNFQVWRLNHHD